FTYLNTPLGIFKSVSKYFYDWLIPIIVLYQIGNKTSVICIFVPAAINNILFKCCLIHILTQDCIIRHIRINEKIIFCYLHVDCHIILLALLTSDIALLL